MSMIEDRLLPLAQKIEEALVHEYERTPGLTDLLCMYGLENARIAVRQRFGFGRNDRVSIVPETKGIVEACEAIAVECIDESVGISLTDFLATMEKVKRSVERHAHDGTRGYYEFVRDFLP